MRSSLSLKPNLKSQNGSGMIAIFVATLFVGVIAWMLIGNSQLQRKTQKQQNISLVAEEIKQKLLNAVLSPKSWQEIQAGNPEAFSIGLQPQQAQQPLLDIYLGEGLAPYYRTTDPRSGFSTQGQTCAEFSIDGNDNCPFRYEVRLLSRAPINGVLVDTLRFTLYFKPVSSNLVLNTSQNKFSFDIVRNFNSASVEAACLLLNGNFNTIAHTCTVNYSQNQTCAPGTSYRGPGVNNCSNTRVVASPCQQNQVIKGFNTQGFPVCGEFL